MIKANNIKFDFGLDNEDKQHDEKSEQKDTVKVDVLTCQVPMNDGAESMTCNRKVYFDPCVSQVDEDTYKVSLQGRKMVGKFFDLKTQKDDAAPGYKGRILSL